MDGNLPATNAKPPKLSELIESLNAPDACKRLAEIRHAVQAPVNLEWLEARKETLFSHYFRPKMDERIEEAADADWFNVLGKFPQFALEAAVSEYLETGTHRPAPGHIARLAKKHLDRVNARIGDLTRPKIVEEPKPKVITGERSNQIAQELGFKVKKFGK